MSLTATDLEAIRKLLHEEVRPIVKEEVRAIFKTEGRAIVKEEVRLMFQTEGRAVVSEEIGKQLKPINQKLGKIDALENEVKAIYFMLADLQNAIKPKPLFSAPPL